MSRRPGIGHQWQKKYAADAYPHGTIIINSKEQKTPRYYDKIYKQKKPKQYQQMIENRKQQAMKQEHDNTNDRRAVKEIVKKAQLSQLKRNLA